MAVKSLSLAVTTADSLDDSSNTEALIEGAPGVDFVEKDGC